MSDGATRSSPSRRSLVGPLFTATVILTQGFGADLFSQTPLLASVQSGTATSQGAGTLTVPLSPVNPAKAFLLFQTRHDRNRPPQSMLRGRIADATSLEFERVTDQSSPIDIQWYVVEYPSGVQVQRGEIPSQNATSISVPIVPLTSANQAFVTWSKTPAATNNAFDNRQPVLMEVALPPDVPDQVNLRVDGAASAHIIWWQVVEFLDPLNVNVQRGSTSMNTSQLSVEATLSTPANVGTSFVLVGYTSEDGTLLVGAAMLRAQLIDATTVRIDRSVSGIALPEIAWQVVDLKDGSTTSRGSENFPAGVTQRIVPISPVDTSRAAAFASVQPVGGQNMGRSSLTADDRIGVGSVTMGLSGSSIVMERNNSDADADIGWFVVEWGAAGLPPALNSIAPTQGSPLGGETITLTGAELIAATAVSFGGVLATSVTLVNSNTLTAVTPAHAPGTVDVAISNEFGSDTLVGAFTFNSPPVLTAVSPGNGSPLGGDTVTLTGTDFTSNVAVDFGGIAPSALTFVDSTTLLVTTAAHAPGAVDVSVSNANGSSTLQGIYLYDSPPALISVNPNAGTPFGGDNVTLSGSDFTPGDVVTLDGIAATSVTLVDANTLTVVTPPHPPGAVDVTVSNNNGTDTLLGGFTYNNPPALTSISPDNGSPLGGDTITVFGADFTATTVVAFDGVASPAVTLVDPGTLDAVTPGHPSGTVDVSVSNENGSAVLSASFIYNPEPQLTSVNPTQGIPAGGELVTLSGANFSADAVAAFGGISAVTTFVDATTLEAITPPHPGGLIDVSVTNVNGTSLLPASFLVVAPPTLTSVTPNRGPLGGGISVTLTGTGYQANETVAFGSSPAPQVTFINSGTLDVVTPANPAGVFDIVVTGPEGAASLLQAFTYLPVPSLTQLNPRDGGLAGGTTVTITGTDLSILGDVTVTFGGRPGTVIDVQSEMAVIVDSPAGFLPGPVDVVVTTSGGSAAAVGGFSYDTDDTLFLRGDANADGILNVADGIFLIQYLFNPPSMMPSCNDAADSNDDGSLDISDIVYGITFVFQEGTPPPDPYPGCGPDPTQDSLFCIAYPSC